jgi:hypothetical protein
MSYPFTTDSRIYLASRYSDPDPHIMEVRYESVRKATAALLSKGYLVFSPIVYAHEMSKEFNLPKKVGFWWSFNKAMIDWCSVFLIYDTFEHHKSIGLNRERGYAEALNKKISYYY